MAPSSVTSEELQFDSCFRELPLRFQGNDRRNGGEATIEPTPAGTIGLEEKLKRNPNDPSWSILWMKRWSRCRRHEYAYEYAYVSRYTSRFWTLIDAVVSFTQISLRESLWNCGLCSEVQSLSPHTPGSEWKQPEGFRSEAGLCWTGEPKLQIGNSEVSSWFVLVDSVCLQMKIQNRLTTFCLVVCWFKKKKNHTWKTDGWKQLQPHKWLRHYFLCPLLIADWCWQCFCYCAEELWGFIMLPRW